jgi:hypothetical protein
MDIKVISPLTRAVAMIRQMIIAQMRPIPHLSSLLQSGYKMSARSREKASGISTVFMAIMPYIIRVMISSMLAILTERSFLFSLNNINEGFSRYIFESKTAWF